MYAQKKNIKIRMHDIQLDNSGQTQNMNKQVLRFAHGIF